MATVTEHPTSGNGNSTGPDGDDVTRTFIVHIDAVGDSPIGAVEELKVPNGAPHNATRWRHLLASRYSQTATESRLIWHVEVRYSQPSLFAWLLDVDLGTETEVAKQSLEQRDPETGVLVQKSQLIGPRIYIPTSEEQTPTHFTWTNGGKRLDLRWKGHKESQELQVVKPTGLERLTARTSFTLSKRLRTLSRGNIQDIMNGRAVVSDDDFAFQPKGNVLMTGISVRERDGSIDARTDGSQTGLSYDVSVHFIVDKAGWSPQRVFDVFISEEGFESPVIAINPGPGQIAGPAFRDFHLYQTDSMNALMTRLDKSWVPFAQPRQVFVGRRP